MVLSPRSQQALLSLPAFRGLGEAERKQVAERVREIALEKGEIVYRAGDDADALYLVVAGAVDVLDGERVITRYGPGEVFGEAVLVPDERRAMTTCVALDAVLLVLERGYLERLLALHPSLYGRVSALLARRLKEAVRAALATTQPRSSEIVVLQGWRSEVERRAFLGALAGALEHELGRPVAIVTVACATRSSAVVTRSDRPDAVVLGEASERAALRERVAAELALRATQAPVVLAAVDDALVALEADLVCLADTVLVRVEDGRPAERDTASGRLVFVHDRRARSRPSLSGNELVSLPIEDSGRGRVLGRLARHLTRRSVGLALGSGAAWGFAHIGVLDVLEREQIPIDVVAGASMGAIVGGHYALGFTPARLEEIATSVRNIPDIVRILPRLLYLAVDFNVRRPGLFAGEHFQRVLESLGPIKGSTFADLETPFRAIATDVGTGASVELADGNLSDAMRASFSAPWIFSPFRIGEHILIDGGMSDPVPAATVRSMGADLVIGVNVVPPVYPPGPEPTRGGSARARAGQPDGVRQSHASAEQLRRGRTHTPDHAARAGKRPGGGGRSPHHPRPARVLGPRVLEGSGADRAGPACCRGGAPRDPEQARRTAREDRVTRLSAASLLLVLAAVASARAATLAGVEMPDTVTVDGTTLVLNGIGLREATRLRIKAYVGALYLEKPSSDAATVIDSRQPKPVTLKFLRDIDRRNLASGWADSLRKIGGKAMEPSIAHFTSHRRREEGRRHVVHLAARRGCRCHAGRQEPRQRSRRRLRSHALHRLVRPEAGR
jgi:predicted acylesterase/phospholipase RssA/CRP-like cAMP-binding protein